MNMSLEWPEMLLRLVLTLLAGIVLGINRSERGRAAGLRTTVLVCLAASISMIQVNLLLPLRGKEPDSFNVLDLMRLPLGILTGMGFIGAGAILRKDDSVQGVTTAATLWLTTVIGLCLGGGQIALGLVGTGVAIAVLWSLKRLEDVLRRDRRATLVVRIRGESPSESSLLDAIAVARFDIEAWDVTQRVVGGVTLVTIRTDLRWHGRRTETQPPLLVQQLGREPGVIAFRWSA
jgi:putative Mg2+ transporter-C (MgtC) family protein